MDNNKNQLGINNGYSAWMRAQWRSDPTQIQPAWQRYLANGHSDADTATTPPHVNGVQPNGTDSSKQTDAQQQPPQNSTKLAGAAKQIAANMQASLEIPTATSCRDVPTKLLQENRAVINHHLQQHNQPRCSFTHLVAYAMLQALKDHPALQSYCQRHAGHFTRVSPGNINLGLAMDLPAHRSQNGQHPPDHTASRMLVVPNIKRAESLNFAQFISAYNDLVQRAKAGKLQLSDFQDTLVTLTNPGTLGTDASHPRLMQQQALIVATGRIGYPAWASSMHPDMLQQLAISKVMTLTSTYDHRIIQGAESGRFLAHIHALLLGEHHFYDEIFTCLNIKQPPYRHEQQHPAAAPLAALANTTKQTHNEQHARQQPNDSTALLQHLTDNIRNEGHVWADINPLQPPPAWPLAQQALRLDAQAQHKLQQLKQAYMGHLAPEFMQLQHEKQRAWWMQQVEQTPTACTAQQQQSLLQRLIQAENFAHFLHKRFVGHKRFGIEGAESLLVVLDGLLAYSAQQGVQQVGIAMPHRGRLNVLAHVLGKPYKEILTEFDPDFHIPGFCGDVKHHTGRGAASLTMPSRQLQSDGHLHNDSADAQHATGSTTSQQASPGNLRGIPSGQLQSDGHLQHNSANAQHVATGSTTSQQRTQCWMANNPSHLEAVYPVLLGMVRAQQDLHGEVSEQQRVLGIVMHGDASFAGQGVVYESLQLSRLPAYNTQGSVHVIVDNQIGYTTPATQGRSTRYCSDLAHTFGLPVLHVNADDPEACLRAAQLAVQYRQQFHEDVIIHLLAYRRNGHNEADDPSITQPQLYQSIKQHPSVTTQYGQQLVQQGVVASKQLQQMQQQHWHSLDQAAKAAAQQHTTPSQQPAALTTQQLDNSNHPPVRSHTAATNSPTNTGVAQEMLCSLGQQLTQLPADFQPHPRVQTHVLQRRQQMMQTGQQLDFGMTEQLAYASLLTEGIPIRLCGQDSQRGTFAHRHAVLHDVQTGNTTMPLQHLHIPQHLATDTTPKPQRMQCYNSPLSEAAALGFEYGYSVSNPQALVIWEAQFGDFCNGAQVHIDQFIAAGHAKWHQTCRLVLMLPHGYEGQGPEHSSARLERFLQLCAQNNMRVATCIQSCQLFHLLRDQAHAGRCPLVLLLPKSLLRSVQATCSLSDLTTGCFQPVLGDSAKQIKQAKRLILCSGKLFWQLDNLRKQQIQQGIHPPVALVQLQQLYPWPHNTLKEMLQPSLAKEIVWLQEEPANMGAYSFCAPMLQQLLKPRQLLRYIGRASSASPATGYAYVHKQQQDQLLQAALAPLQPNAKHVYV